MALLNAAFMTAILTLTLVTMVTFTQNTFKATRKNEQESQAYSVARAGLVEAIAYFKRQEAQPVEAFTPQANPTNPLKGDTNDPLAIDPGGSTSSTPNLGIVQEFPVNKERNLWGRFEVGKITKLSRDGDGNLTLYRVKERDPGTREWKLLPYWDCVSTEYEGVLDVTEDYGLAGKGLIWRIRSHGYVYYKDPAAPEGTHFYTAPNRVLQHVELDTEIFRLQFKDYNSAVTCRNPEDAIIQKAGPVKGGEGFALLLNSGPLVSPTDSATLTSDVPPAVMFIADDPNLPPNDLDWLEVFGVSDPSVIAGLADSSGTDHSAYQNKPMALTYLKPPPGTPITFIRNSVNREGHKCLTGGGILVIDGDLHVQNWCANNFTGFIYVSGNATLKGLNSLQGQMVVRGKLDLNPTNIEYNKPLLQTIRKRLAQYRERRSSLRVLKED